MFECSVNREMSVVCAYMSLFLPMSTTNNRRVENKISWASLYATMIHFLIVNDDLFVFVVPTMCIIRYILNSSVYS